MEFEYRNWDWKPEGKVSLPDYIFDAPLRKDIIARVIRWQRAKSRSGNHSTKTISMVSGTTRKPWAQKETGKARQGSLRSPQFRGGAVVFGPHPRDYEHKLNKKVRALGCVSSICFKFKEGLFSILNDANVPFLKTNAFSNWLKERNFKSVLFVVDSVSDEQKVITLKKCIQNVPYCDFTTVDGLNVLDIVKHKHIICSLEALKKLEQRFEKYQHAFIKNEKSIEIKKKPGKKEKSDSAKIDSANVDSSNVNLSANASSSKIQSKIKKNEEANAIATKKVVKPVSTEPASVKSGEKYEKQHEKSTKEQLQASHHNETSEFKNDSKNGEVKEADKLMNGTLDAKKNAEKSKSSPQEADKKKTQKALKDDSTNPASKQKAKTVDKKEKKQ